MTPSGKNLVAECTTSAHPFAFSLLLFHFFNIAFFYFLFLKFVKLVVARFLRPQFSSTSSDTGMRRDTPVKAHQVSPVGPTDDVAGAGKEVWEVYT